MRRPRIGIAANTMTMTTGDMPGLERTYVNYDYIVSLEKAGAVPVVLPVVKNTELVREMLVGLDGVLLSGGSDIDPAFYGADVNVHCGYINHTVDAFTLCAAKEAYNAGLPVFGICKGIQAINVAFGGTLYQDLPAEKEGSLQHSQMAPRSNPTHEIEIDEDSFLYPVLGSRARVNSFHHQAVKRIADGFRVTARARDGVVECLEKEDGGFVCGVQFHPEMMAAGGNEKMIELFRRFTEKCSID